MTRGTARSVTVAVVVTAVMASAAAVGDEYFHAPPSHSARASQAQHPLEPAAALAFAARCLDPRHVALVGNAARHGRVFLYAEALGWCRP